MSSIACTSVAVPIKATSSAKSSEFIAMLESPTVVVREVAQVRSSLGKLLIYIEYKWGLRTDPCSTPVAGEEGVDKQFDSVTDNVTSSNKCCRRDNIGAGVVVDAKASHMMLRSTVSYAALMSKKAITGGRWR
jgi:hypothetical protein